MYNDEYGANLPDVESSVNISQSGTGGIGIAQTKGQVALMGAASAPMKTILAVTTATTMVPTKTTSVVPLLFPGFTGYQLRLDPLRRLVCPPQ